jgi:hypothetical protein
MFAPGNVGRKRYSSNAFTPWAAMLGEAKALKGFAHRFQPTFPGANMGHPSRNKAREFFRRVLLVPAAGQDDKKKPNA